MSDEISTKTAVICGLLTPLIFLTPYGMAAFLIGLSVLALVAAA